MVKSDEEIFEQRDLVSEIFVIGTAAFKLKVSQVERRDEPSKLAEVVEKCSSTLHDVLRKDILFAVDPEMVKRLLRAVQDLWQVGGFRSELI